MIKFSSIIFIVHIILFLISRGIYAQQSGGYDFSTETLAGAQNTIASVPEIGSLGNVGENNINYIYGSNSINIPVYTIQVGGISIPIGLSYSNRAFRVNEEDGRAGLGWSLNAGGSINVTVNGIADELPNGFRNKGAEVLNFLSKINTYDPTNQVLHDELYNYLTAYENNSLDPAPDTYSFNTGTYSGNFHYLNEPISIGNRTYEIVTVPYEPIVVEYSFNKTNYDLRNAEDCEKFKEKFDVTEDVCENGIKKNILHQTLEEFIETGESIYEVSSNDPFYTITTPEGIKYVYEDFEFTRINRSMEDIMYVSSYYLSKIISKNNADTVYFEYNNFNRNYNSDRSSHILVESNGANSRQISRNINSTERKLIGKKTLKKIKYSNGSVEFFGQDQLSKIVVKNNEGTILEADLVMTNFEKDENCEIDCNRKKLDRLKIGDSEYKFEYSDLKVPGRQSYATDHWGYYNGANNQSSLPTVEYYGVDYGDGADREVNHAYTEFGTLKSISHPTGGQTSFEFEGNKAEGFTYETVESVCMSMVTGDADHISLIKKASINLPESCVVDDIDDEISSYEFDTHAEVEVKYFTPPTNNSEMGPASYPHQPYLEINGERFLYDPDVNSQYFDEYNNVWVQTQRFSIYVGDLNNGETFTAEIGTSNGEEARVELKVTFKLMKKIPALINVGGLRLKNIFTLNQKGDTINTDLLHYRNGKLTSGDLSHFTNNNQYIDRFKRKMTVESEHDYYKNQMLIYDSPQFSSAQSSNPVMYREVIHEKIDHLGIKRYKKIENKLYPDYAASSYPKISKISYDYLRGAVLNSSLYETLSNEETDTLKIYETRRKYIDKFKDNIIGLNVKTNRDYEILKYKLSTIGEVISDNRDLNEFVYTYFNIPYGKSLLAETEELIYSYQEGEQTTYTKLKQINNFTEDLPYFLLRDKSSLNGNDLIKHTYFYPLDKFDYAPEASAESDMIFASRGALKQNLLYSIPIVEFSHFGPEGEYLVQKINLYNGKNLEKQVVSSIRDKNELINVDVNSSFAILPFDGNEIVNNYKYNLKGQVIVTELNGEFTSYIWGNNPNYPTASIRNAESPNNSYYESFEDQEGSTDYAREGNKSLEIFSRYEIPQVFNDGSYTVSYWHLPEPNSNWQHKIEKVNVSSFTPIQIEANQGFIDELRVYPQGAVMNTFQFIEGIGLKSVSDQNNISRSFKYDQNLRMIKEFDSDKNLMQSIKYNLKN
ncbi:hypothetical protein JKA74_15150 [Marivirga sp. S37H4]|uniref:YD repeat-containing protein n=1 Tax=Marivirga aurantiaca TaxID=2802615 RepID=A0A935CA44_9BACT|nr:hypothetical protein [Marivirga aurantiaca]MBK6266380.1 hypothetical protein [Marivirga aurantiaca]